MKNDRSINDYLLFAEAWLLLACARIMLIFMPFKKIIPFLGKIDQSSPPQISANVEVLSPVKLAIRRACSYSPWRTKCFEQALAGKIMLKRRRFETTVFFGVYKDINNKLNAHAWLQTNGQIITGGSNIERYTILSSFRS